MVFTRALYWSASLLILVALTGCGGGGDSAPAGNGSNPTTNAVTPETQATSRPTGATAPTPASGGVLQDACTLLTKAEVEAALATPVGEVLSSLPGTQFPACEFSAPRSRAELLVQVVVNPFFNSNAARGAFDALKPSNAVNVSGLGDGAYWIADTGRLALLKGNHIVSVDVRESGGKDRQAVARELAAKAIPRVP